MGWLDWAAPMVTIPTKAVKKAYGSVSDKGSSGGYQGGQDISFEEADRDSRDRINQLYGNSSNNLGSETEGYVGRLQNNLDRNYARADVINQQGASQRALDNARAGLSGVDMSAQNEQNRRNAGIAGNIANEQMRQNALELYGNSLSNRITGSNSITQQNRALEIAAMQQPASQVSSGGILSGLFDGLF